jgi:hypothetical protein
VVGEDAAIDTPRMAGRRGLAGTALVHKVPRGAVQCYTAVPASCSQCCAGSVLSQLFAWVSNGAAWGGVVGVRQLQGSTARTAASAAGVTAPKVGRLCGSAAVVILAKLLTPAVNLCHACMCLQIAGAAAAAGAPLPAVAELARSVAGRCATLGVALHGCTLPGHPPNTRCGRQWALRYPVPVASIGLPFITCACQCQGCQHNAMIIDDYTALPDAQVESPPAA